MRAVVVYESMFGNTERVARAIADGLGAPGMAEMINVDDVEDLGEVDLLVVGGPTHAHGMTRARTRDEARRQAGKQDSAHGGVRSRTGIRDWLDALGPSTDGRAAAAFDTRFGKPRWLTGSAAVGAAKQLRRRGYRLVAQPESFLVTGSAPGEHLRPGELARAREWAAGLLVSTGR
ncbi:MAG TPA: flavodoxin domain-containing protein [Amycolatopsis sp.]|jgi:hypothetical protein|nr:flavodoxin domain-containing protein [Amycolatopsis sp.]